MSVVIYLYSGSGPVIERSNRNEIEIQLFVLPVELRWKYLQLSLNSMLAGKVDSALSAMSWDLKKQNNSIRSEDMF